MKLSQIKTAIASLAKSQAKLDDVVLGAIDNCLANSFSAAGLNLIMVHLTEFGNTRLAKQFARYVFAVSPMYWNDSQFTFKYNKKRNTPEHHVEMAKNLGIYWRHLLHENATPKTPIIPTLAVRIERAQKAFDASDAKPSKADRVEALTVLLGGMSGAEIVEAIEAAGKTQFVMAPPKQERTKRAAASKTTH